MVPTGDNLDLADDWAEEAVIEKPAFVPETNTESPKGLSYKELIVEMYFKGWRGSTGAKLKVEILLILGIIAYTANIFIGRRKNDQIAQAWARAFCLPGGIVEKNFHMVGIGESLIPQVWSVGSASLSKSVMQVCTILDDCL